MQQFFFLQRLMDGGTNVQAAFRHIKIFRDFALDEMRVDIDGCRCINRISQCFEGDPDPGIARHRPAMQAHIQKFLHIGGVQNGDHGVHEGIFSLVGGG